MTTILSLPEEILLIIFKELWPNPTKECKRVCKAWYFPLHKMDLENIHITFSKVQTFIASIDHNPDPSYLNAVKSIDISSYDHFYYQKRPKQQHALGKEMVQKLFCRFRNLKKVMLDDSAIPYDDFNDEICMTILQSCPKLDTFKTGLTLDDPFFEEYAIQTKQDRYLKTLYKMRLLLTSIDLGNVDFRSRSETPMEILGKFPRIENITGVPELDNFQKLLPVFLQLSNVKSISMERVIDDEENFAELYINSKTNEEQNQLKNALSNINSLDVRYRATFGVNSIAFVSKYFTGLESFSMASYDNEDLTDLQQKLLLSIITDLVCSAKNHGEAYFSDFQLEDLSRYVPLIFPKVYEKTSNDLLNNVFRVEITNPSATSQNVADLRIASRTSQSTRNIDIFVTNEVSLHEIMTHFCYKIPSPNNINKFIVDMDLYRQEYEHEITTDMYDAILNTIPSLKEVVLEIPPSYVESPVSSSIVHPLLEKVTLLVTAGEKSQAIINEFSSRFPKLNQLSIFYFCGIWNEESQEYQIMFPEYSVERLVLDLTPIKLGVDRRDRENKFIVVHVCLSSRNEQYLYKIPMHAGLTRTIINESDLDGLKSEEDYYRVRITINNVRRLDIYLLFFVSRFEQRYLRHASFEPYITLFDDKT